MARLCKCPECGSTSKRMVRNEVITMRSGKKLSKPWPTTRYMCGRCKKEYLHPWLPHDYK